MDIKGIISKMTVEEKAGLCSGKDFWRTKAVERLGVPQIMVSDGPHGLRKQDDQADHMGVNDAIKAVCFPAGCAASATFNRELIEEMGKALGDECQAENVAVILGPAVNIKRSPLCGRNFEYYSEDPYLAGEIAKSHIRGVQSRNVGTSIKHFLANSQEHRRLTSSSEIDERTIREIYLPAFETAVKEEQPWTVMCSYNRINGIHASENKTYLTDILREEWGFEGFVVSDWGAVNNRVKGLEAGLDLEMPSTIGDYNDKLIVDAVKNGELSEEVLDKACERILRIVERYTENRAEGTEFDYDAHHSLARKIAEEGIVLLKNEDNILPVKKEEKLAVIGAFAKVPRYQGGGSSHINSYKVDSALDFIGGLENVTFALGYEAESDRPDEKLISEAVETAKNADKAIIFAGLPDSFESEGFDRGHMRMPACQNELIMRVSKVQPNVIVVLHNGSPVEMPWVNEVKGILEAYLGGQAIAGAVCDVLFGNVNPSGKLGETFPIRLEDNPSYLYYIGEKDRVEYREGVFVGYRYYDKKKMDVLFPFGHGLSYTTFGYKFITLDKETMSDKDELRVTVTVKNTGKVYGKETVQLYVAPKTEGVIRPVRELKGFEKVSLMPGEEKEVTFILSKRDFSYWNTEIHDWFAQSGEYVIEAGSSSRDIRLGKSVEMCSGDKVPVVYDLNTTVGDLLKNKATRDIFKDYEHMFALGVDSHDVEEATMGASTLKMQISILECLPLRNALNFGTESADFSKVLELIRRLNEHKE